MIILPDHNSPRGKVLMPMRRRGWIEASARPSFAPLEHGTRSMWHVTAKTHDGVSVWRGDFYDREDADAFLYGIVTGSIMQEPALWRLPTPHWHPDLAPPELLFVTATVSFLSTAGDGTYTVPLDWNSAGNFVDCIGGGSAGFGGGYGPGGGAGAWARKNNAVLIGNASIHYHVAGVADNSYFNGASYGVSVVAAAGTGSTGGGSSASCIGDQSYSGGSGGGGSFDAATAGGGGGAAGPHGPGGGGGVGGGGNGDAGFGPTSYDATHGSGGGGTGGNASVTPQPGTSGGIYGAGGGGNAGAGSGNGAQGLIVTSYTASVVSLFSLSQPMLGM